MRVQSLNRTLIDKVFAVCDYYLHSKAHRNARHLLASGLFYAYENAANAAFIEETRTVLDKTLQKSYLK